MARHTLPLIAAGLGGWLLVSTASAAPAADAPVRHVSYHRLDLTTDAGVESLYARLRHAADEVCGSVNIRDLASLAQHQACAQQALDRAVEDVHSERLSARHKGASAGPRYARLN
jgi:UrcA family protein